MEKIHQDQDSGLEKSDKQILWDKQIAFLDSLSSEEEKFDENIKETVAALNLNGLRTIASCGGHTEEERHAGDMPFPWILISSEGKSEGNHLSSYDRIRILLEEFYTNRQIEENVKLKASDVEYEQFTLSSIIDKDLTELTEEEKNSLAKELPKSQKEMQDFGQFLKAKFFAND